MLQIFDLLQFVREPTRVTQTSATLIDHVYYSHPEKYIIALFQNIFITRGFAELQIMKKWKWPYL